jgi:hypothetical protein
MTDTDYHDDARRAGAECLAAALDYLSRGWSVLGLCPPDHVGVGKDHARTCGSPGKRPYPDGGAWKRWQEERPDREEVERWWRLHATLNVGMALGPVSGLVRVDVDGPAGEAALLELSGGDLPPTLEFFSGKPGSRGLLYAIPDGVTLRTTVRGEDGEELRLQAKGAQTVLPPSRHESGSRYSWAEGRSPGEIEAAPCPAWLVAALSPDAPRGKDGRAEPESLADGEVIPAGKCDQTLTSMAGTMRRRGFSVGAIRAALLAEIEDGRVEQADGKRAYDATDADRIARSVGKYTPDPMRGVTILVPAEPGINGIAGNGAPRTVPREPPRKWLHDQLLDEHFPPLRWLVDQLILEGGFTILGGKKKLGKSWLCLQIAVAVAVGAKTLLRDVVSGPVVYICLEDGERRLQDRLRKQKASRGLPITWYTTFPKLDDGGLEELERVASEHPRLIIMDTLAAAKTGKVDENSSGPMADLGNELRRIAQANSVGLLATHHHGKFSYGDPGDDLRGSSALAAAADVNLGLYRIDDAFRLRGEGRDIEPCDFAIRFDANGEWVWKMLGDARVIASDQADSVILLALAALGEATTAAVASFVNKGETAVRERLQDLLEKKKVLARESPEKKRGRPHILYRLPPADAAIDRELM